MRRYHDEEWACRCTNDRVLFEFLTLEGAQAGLSWSTILKKRENYPRSVRWIRSGEGRALRTRGAGRPS